MVQGRLQDDVQMELRRLDDMVQKTGRLTEKKLLSVFDKLCKAGWYQRNWRREGLLIMGPRQ